ncbi:prkC_5, partial [Symbiodinium sp. CCMP2456]
MSISFPQNSLEFALRDIGEEAGVPIEIKGGDLQLDGITRNKEIKDFTHENKPAGEILAQLLVRANPEASPGPNTEVQKLIYVIHPMDGPEDAKKVVVTTRKAAETNNYTLPDTCSARLKVNSRSLIGQIVNCPKCGSMLEIADPDSAPAPSEKKAKEVAPVAPVVKPEPTPPAETPPRAVTSPESSTEPEVPASDAAATSSDGAFDQLDEMLDDSPAEDAAVATPSEAASATTPPIESGRFADSASVGKWRNVALIGGTAVMAVTTFAIIGYAVFSGSNASPTPAPEEVEPTQVAQFEPPEEETKPAEEETQP